MAAAAVTMGVMATHTSASVQSNGNLPHPSKKKRESLEEAWVTQINNEKEGQETAGGITVDEYMESYTDQVSKSCFSFCDAESKVEGGLEDSDDPPQEPLLYYVSDDEWPLFHPDSFEINMFEYFIVAVVIYSTFMTPIEVAWGNFSLPFQVS